MPGPYRGAVLRCRGHACVARGKPQPATVCLIAFNPLSTEALLSPRPQGAVGRDTGARVGYETLNHEADRSLRSRLSTQPKLQ